MQKTLREPETLITLDFLSSQDDSSLFVYHFMLEIVYLFLYVDDMVLTDNNPFIIHTFITRFSK